MGDFMTNNEATMSTRYSNRQNRPNRFFNANTFISAGVMFLGLVALATARYMLYSNVVNEAENSLDNLKNLKESETLKNVESGENLLHSECTMEKARTQSFFTESGQSFWTKCGEILYPNPDEWEWIKFQASFHDPKRVYKKAEPKHELPPSIVNGVRVPH